MSLMLAECQSRRLFEELRLVAMASLLQRLDSILRVYRPIETLKVGWTRIAMISLPLLLFRLSEIQNSSSILKCPNAENFIQWLPSAKIENNEVSYKTADEDLSSLPVCSNFAWPSSKANLPGHLICSALYFGHLSVTDSSDPSRFRHERFSMSLTTTTIVPKGTPAWRYVTSSSPTKNYAAFKIISGMSILFTTLIESIYEYN